MSIFEKLFGGNPAPAPAPSTPPTGTTNPGQPLPGTAASAGTAPNGVVPANAPAPNPSPSPAPGPATPLDGFKDLWQTPTNPNPEEPASLFGNVDPQKLMESARKVDFAKTLSAENLQKIQAGGQEAVAALAESLNSVAQSVYAQSALATTKIVEQALTKQQEQFDARLPTMVKRFSANENLLANNPLLSNPAIQPLVGALQEQLVRKNPNATSTEIQQQVNDYFAALGNTFAPKPAEAPNAGKAKPSEDWEKFLSM